MGPPAYFCKCSSSPSKAMGQTSLAKNAQHFSRLHDDAVAAAARVAGRGEGSVFAMLDGRGAAEIEVPPPPAHELVAPALEPVELGRVEPPFAVDMRILEMNARLLDGGADVHPVD